MTERLTKKEKGFADDYIETGNGTKAALDNYNVSNENTAASIASQNLRRVKIQEYIQQHAEAAESMIYSLSQNAQAENVRLGASKDILDRAGFKPIEQSININLNQEQTPDQLAKAQLFNEWFKKQQI